MATSIAWFAACTDTPSDTGSLESALNGIMLEKAQRAGYYQSAARQAEKSGYAEVATYLGELAQEEQSQASKLSILKAAPGKDAKKNLGTCIAMEKAAGGKYPALISLAKEEGNDSLSIFLAQMQADEQRHAAGLKGIMERLK